MALVSSRGGDGPDWNEGEPSVRVQAIGFTDPNPDQGTAGREGSRRIHMP